MAKPRSQVERPPDPSRLSDDECDFILQRVLWGLQGLAGSGEFKTAFGAGLLLGVHDWERARGIVRTFYKAER